MSKTKMNHVEMFSRLMSSNTYLVILTPVIILFEPLLSKFLS